MATMYGLQPSQPASGCDPGRMKLDRGRGWLRKRAPVFVQSSHDALSTLIEGEIIPQLLAAHRVSSPPVAAPRPTRIDAAEATRFAPLALELDADELLAHVDALLESGVAAESVFVDLLAPAARKLGEMWEDDACDFVDVTIGLWRLQEVMRQVAWRTPVITGPAFAERSALFSPMPGEQHSFGSLMLEQMFSRAGWQCELLIEPQRRQLLAQLGAAHFDLIGLTISRDCHSGALSDLVHAIRAVSLNPKLVVLVGGRAINADPALADSSGADGTAPDGQTALALADRLVLKAEVEAGLALTE